MLLLVMCGVLLVIVFGVFVLTQLLIPLFAGTKLFPMFRLSPLKEKVHETANEVHELREQVNALDQLVALKKQREHLQQRLEKVNLPE